MKISMVSPSLSRSFFAVSMPFVPSICMSRKTMSNCFPAASRLSPVSKSSGHKPVFSISSFICSRMAFSSSHMAIFNLHHLQFVSHEDQLPHGQFFLLFISADIFRISPGGNETLFEMERNLFSFLKNIKITPKVFRFSSDIPFPSHFRYQAARPACGNS